MLKNAKKKQRMTGPNIRKLKYSLLTIGAFWTILPVPPGLPAASYYQIRVIQMSLGDIFPERGHLAFPVNIVIHV